MKLKSLVFVLVVSLVARSTFGATLGAWNNATDVDGVVGSWSNAVMWQSNAVPVPSASTSDEVKIQTVGSDCTIDGVGGTSYDYIARLTSGSNDSAAPVVIRIQESDIETPTYFGMGEFRVGATANSTSNSYCQVYQTGGTLLVNDIMLSRNKAQAAGYTGNGTYTISGGTIQYRAGSVGRIEIGSYTETSGTAGTGKFIVDGDGGTITMRYLYAGSQAGSFAGVGDATLQYNLTSEGNVSKITVERTYLDQVADSLTKLLVNATNAPTADVILLVDNTSAFAVAGTFDTINGIAAAEGAVVNLAGANYILTYLYDSVTQTAGAGNDIALLIPEPATIALFSLSLIALRRKK